MIFWLFWTVSQYFYKPIHNDTKQLFSECSYLFRAYQCMCNCICFPLWVHYFAFINSGLICQFYHSVIHKCMIPLRIFVVSFNFVPSSGCCFLCISPFPNYLWVVEQCVQHRRLKSSVRNLHCKKVTSLQHRFLIFSSFFLKTLCYKAMRQLWPSCYGNLVTLRIFIKTIYKSLLEIQAVYIILINFIQDVL